MLSQNDKVCLYIQLKNQFIERIQNKELLSASRLPGEFKLMSQYQVSRATVQKALRELETEGYIERIDKRGTFVREKPGKISSVAKIVFPFPEKSISVEELGLNNWASSSEIYRGLMQGALENKSQLTMRYLPVTGDSRILQDQVKEIMTFDGAIFLGLQMKLLMSELKKKGFPYLIISPGRFFHDPVVPFVEYLGLEVVAEVANYLADLGYVSAGVITGKLLDPEKDPKIQVCRRVFSEREISFSPDRIIRIDTGADNILQELEKKIPATKDELPQVFFCLTNVLAHALLRLTQTRNWRVPEDLGIIAFANNTILNPSVPLLTSVCIPHFEMGLEAFRIMSEGINHGEFRTLEKLLPARIVAGETVGQQKKPVFV